MQRRGDGLTQLGVGDSEQLQFARDVAGDQRVPGRGAGRIARS